VNPKILIFLFLISLTGLSTLLAQKEKPSDYGIKSKKALEFYFQGKEREQWRDRAGAIKAYEEAIKIEPDFAHAHMGIGANAYTLYRFELAITHIEKARELNKEAFPISGFFLGESYFYTEQYAKAIGPYEEFLQTGGALKKFYLTAEENLVKSKFSASAIQEPVRFTPVNLGPKINSEDDEYLPYLTADDGLILFTSKRKGSTGGFNPYLKGYAEDFYSSEYVDGKWQEAKNLGEPINTEMNEGAQCLSQDGRYLFFTACNYEDGFGNCDLYYSVRTDDGWAKPKNLGPRVNSPHWDSQPSLSHDGKVLYFASTRPGGSGGQDIWFCRRLESGWSDAQNLGETINSPGNEGTPFIHADGISLYFYSDYHPGFGRQDLFVSYQLPTGEWSAPRNLGYPLNTAADEANIFVNTKGNRGYINSNREGGFGKNDLYTFELDERYRPKIATFLRGITRDSLTHTPVPARIRLVDVESGDTIREIYSGRSDGKFLMSLPLNREYAAHVEASGYMFASKHFYLKELKDEVYFDLTIDLEPIRKGVSVVLRNIFFEFGSYDLKDNSKTELEFLIYFMSRNPDMRVQIQGHTDNVGTEADNLNLSQKRAESVRNYLVSQGIDAGRIQAKGFGESKPVATNETEEGRAQNRRTEFTVLDF
jgi:outer membrane protein OmpA-like peptidoglycan-associated protein/tetratricopeptide (TPR) repeat protein